MKRIFVATVLATFALGLLLLGRLPRIGRVVAWSGIALIALCGVASAWLTARRHVPVSEAPAG